MDEEAFELFYAQTSVPLRRYIAHVLGRIQDVDDVFQESYIRFLGRPPAGSDPRILRAYLFKIASNLMMTYWRRHRHEAGASEIADNQAAVDRDHGVKLDLGRCFHQLPSRDRQLMWLAYVEGATHREIAGAIGVSEASVRVLLFRARRTLVECLDRLGYRKEKS